MEDQENIVNTVIEPMAKDGLRTICVAYKDLVSGKKLRYYEGSLVIS